MTREEIMRLANALIWELLQSDDGDFVDCVINAVSCGEMFDEVEINDWGEEDD